MASSLAQAMARTGDLRDLSVGYVLGVDQAHSRLEVLLDGTRTLLPRADDDYRAGDAVLVARATSRSGSGQWVLGTVAKIRELLAQPAVGTVQSLGAGTLTVSTAYGSYVAESAAGPALASGSTFAVLDGAWGSAGMTIGTGDRVHLDWDATGACWVTGKLGTAPAVPATPGTPTLSRENGVVTASWNQVTGATTYLVWWTPDGTTWSQTRLTKSPASLGIGVGQTISVQIQAANSAGTSARSNSASISWPVPTPETEQVTTIIRPTWSGTWRASSAAWDAWDATDRYGGVSTCYQGAAPSSGPLVGLAVYGTQVADLGAVSIERARVSLRGAGLPDAPTTLVIQGTAQGTPRPAGGPAPTGPAASIAPATTSALDEADLPTAICEALRTGTTLGLALVGLGYGAVRGTSAADGMTLAITYTRII